MFELITFSFPVDSSSRIQHLHLSICSKCRKKPLSLLLPRLVPHSLAFSAFLRKSRLHVFGARYSYKQLNLQMNPPTSPVRDGVDLCEISRVAWQAWQTLLAMRNRRQASERRRPSLILSAAAPLPTFSAATGPYHCRCHLDWGINQTSPCNVSLVEVRMRERKRYLQIRMAELISFSAGRREREANGFPFPSPFRNLHSIPFCRIISTDDGEQPSRSVSLSLSLSLHGCATFHFCRHHLYCFAHMQRTEGRKEGTKGRSRRSVSRYAANHA